MKNSTPKEIVICKRSKRSVAGSYFWLMIGMICIVVLFGIFIMIGAANKISRINKNNSMEKENVYYSDNKIVVYSVEGPIYRFTLDQFDTVNFHIKRNILIINNSKIGYCTEYDFKDFLYNLEFIRNKNTK